MGLYKRGKVWWIDITHRGRRVRCSTETGNRKLAEKIYAKVKTELAEGRWFDRLPGEKKTFREMMEKYLREHSAVNKTLKSHTRDRGIAAHLLEFFGDTPLSHISPKVIYEYKQKRKKDGVSPRTINYELSLMRHAFNLAIREWEWVKENPVSRVSREKETTRIERWLTFEEEEKLLNASPEWLRDILIVALDTGLRQGELLDLKVSQIDLKRGVLIITEQKNRSVDTLPLTERAKGVFRKRLRVRHIRSDYVFPNSKGNKMDNRNLLRAFYSAVKKAGIPKLRFHDLRHTFATRLVQAGVDIYTVQKLGRWKSIEMVMRYAHHYPESLRRGTEVLDMLWKNYVTNLPQSKEKGAGDDA